MKKAVIIQARMTSTRLPGKVLMNLAGKSALERVIERCMESNVDDVIVATTTNETDNPIQDLCIKLKCNYFRGSEDDVLNRVLSCAKAHDVNTIVEITADCPLIDYEHINFLLELHGEGTAVDMTTNIKSRTFPRGYDIRIFNTSVLEKVNRQVDNPVDRQHVSTWMYLNPEGAKDYLVLNWAATGKEKRPDLDITLDTPEDYELIDALFNIGKEYRLELSCEEVINIIDTYPYLYKKVKKVQRKDYLSELNEYYKKGAVNDECTDNRSGKTRSLSRCTGVRK